MRLPKLAIENYQFTVIIFLALIVLGVTGFFNMPSSEDPPVSPPGVTVAAIYPGTSPVDMERLVAEPIEESINELEDIKELKVIVENGLAVVAVEFETYSDTDEKFREVQQHE